MSSMEVIETNDFISGSRANNLALTMFTNPGLSRFNVGFIYQE
jgi:hypothetical protein